MNNHTEQPGKIVRKMSRLALMSFILCILMLLIIFIRLLIRGFGGVIFLIGYPISALSSIITGSIAINQIKKSNKTKKGLGLSIVGIIFGSLGMIPILYFLLLIAFMSISEKYQSTIPIITITPIPTFTPQNTSTPTSTYTFTPTSTPDTLVKAAMQEYFAACTDVKSCVNWLFNYGWRYDAEANDTLYGQGDIPSPVKTFANKIGDCDTIAFEIAYGMYMGPSHTPPAILVFSAPAIGHTIYVSQDLISQKWGYAEIGGGPIFRGGYDSIRDLATVYNINHGSILKKYTLITEKDFPADWIINGVQNSDNVTYTENGVFP
jgi:hypothetical protein